MLPARGSMPSKTKTCLNRNTLFFIVILSQQVLMYYFFSFKIFSEWQKVKDNIISFLAATPEKSVKYEHFVLVCRPIIILNKRLCSSIRRAPVGCAYLNNFFILYLISSFYYFSGNNYYFLVQNTITINSDQDTSILPTFVPIKQLPQLSEVKITLFFDFVLNILSQLHGCPN